MTIHSETAQTAAEIFGSPSANPGGVDILVDIDKTFIFEIGSTIDDERIIINDVLIDSLLAAGITEIYLFSSMSADDPKKIANEKQVAINEESNKIPISRYELIEHLKKRGITVKGVLTTGDLNLAATKKDELPTFETFIEQLFKTNSAGYSNAQPQTMLEKFMSDFLKTQEKDLATTNSDFTWQAINQLKIAYDQIQAILSSGKPVLGQLYEAMKLYYGRPYQKLNSDLGLAAFMFVFKEMLGTAPDEELKKRMPANNWQDAPYQKQWMAELFVEAKRKLGAACKRFIILDDDLHNIDKVTAVANAEVQASGMLVENAAPSVYKLSLQDQQGLTAYQFSYACSAVGIEPAKELLNAAVSFNYTNYLRDIAVNLLKRELAGRSENLWTAVAKRLQEASLAKNEADIRKFKTTLDHVMTVVEAERKALSRLTSNITPEELAVLCEELSALRSIELSKQVPNATQSRETTYIKLDFCIKFEDIAKQTRQHSVFIKEHGGNQSLVWSRSAPPTLFTTPSSAPVSTNDDSPSPNAKPSIGASRLKKSPPTRQ